MTHDGSDDDSLTTRWTKQGFDRLLSVHRPAVMAHLRSIRKHHPAASPDEVVRILEKRYLAAVTAGGAATGAVAVVPGVGTVASIGISGVETAGFLEASALFAQSVAEIHGVSTENAEHTSTLVMALMLGPTGNNLVQQFAGEVTGEGKPRSAYWGELVSNRLPSTVLKTLTSRVKKSFVKRFAARQGANVAFRAIPFGIGAVVGGAGNRIAGQRVVKATREAFGPSPATFPGEITLPDGSKAVTSG